LVYTQPVRAFLGVAIYLSDLGSQLCINDLKGDGNVPLRNKHKHLLGDTANSVLMHGPELRVFSYQKTFSHKSRLDIKIMYT